MPRAYSQNPRRMRITNRQIEDARAESESGPRADQGQHRMNMIASIMRRRGVEGHPLSSERVIRKIFDAVKDWSVRQHEATWKRR